MYVTFKFYLKKCEMVMNMVVMGLVHPGSSKHRRKQLRQQLRMILTKDYSSKKDNIN